MEQRFTFSVSQAGTVGPLAETERMAAPLVQFAKDNRLRRSQCQVPMTLAVALGERVAAEAKRRTYDNRSTYSEAINRLALDYPASVAMSQWLRCMDGDPQAICDVQVQP